MRFVTVAAGLACVLALGATPAFAQQSLDARVQSITNALKILCVEGGSETSWSGQADLELRSKIRDVFTGNMGAAGGGNGQFTQHTWDGIIGGISKDMTEIQAQQSSEARKCMREDGFPLVKAAIDKN